MNSKAYLEEHCESKFYPHDFATMMGLRQASHDFIQAAWLLFKKVKGRISLYDVKKRLGDPARKELGELEISSYGQHFLDSGAFTQWKLARKWAKRKGKPQKEYYLTGRFHRYIVSYVEFIKKYEIGIDHYATIDAIGDPETTWEIQQILEDAYGLHPVPVVHFGSDLLWLDHYLKRGHDFIGIGIFGKGASAHCRKWLNQVFERVCQPPSYLPIVRLHGFAMTRFDLITQFPWYSVDSASWAKAGSFGNIFVPHKRAGKFVFNEKPYILKIAANSSKEGTAKGRHFEGLSKDEQHIIMEWLDFIGMKLGEYGRDGKVIQHGVITRHSERKAANLYFFDHLQRDIPAYPWAWKPKGIRGFDFL